MGDGQFVQTPYLFPRGTSTWSNRRVDGDGRSGSRITSIYHIKDLTGPAGRPRSVMRSFALFAFLSATYGLGKPNPLYLFRSIYPHGRQGSRPSGPGLGTCEIHRGVNRAVLVHHYTPSPKVEGERSHVFRSGFSRERINLRGKVVRL